MFGSGPYNSSNRAADGEIQPPGPRGATQYTRADLSRFLPPVRPANSGAQLRQLPIDLREFATGLFLVGFVALAALPFFVGFAGYRLLNP